jgi:DNA polymerase-2
MTLNGPEPLPYLNSAIGYDFYFGQQLAPIAIAILGLKGNSLSLFMDKQVGLFDKDVDLFLCKPCTEA